MERMLRIILGIFFSIFIIGCIAPPAQNPGSVVRPAPDRSVVKRTDEAYAERDRLKKENKELQARLKDYSDRKRKTSTTRRGGGECEGDRDCEEICDDIYDRRADREDCEELSVAAVESLEIVYELLEDPDEDDLVDIDPTDFEALIDISIEPVDDLFGRYSSREAREVAVWIAENPDIAAILQDEDDDFQLFEAIFREIGSNGNALDGLGRTITGGDNFMEILITENNAEALEWVHSYISDKDMWFQ